jgi:uncharacterized membrane protein YphA (DoxX/SURF4 family)
VTHIDSETKRESRLLFPGLESFYAVAIPLAWPIVRIAVGWNLLVHGWGKVTRGPSAYVRAFVEQGFDPALPWIWAALIIEFAGGIALIIGLFTRFFAAAAASKCLSSRYSIGRPDFPGSTAATSTRCCGVSCASPSRCGAQGLIQSIAGSV